MSSEYLKRANRGAGRKMEPRKKVFIEIYHLTNGQAKKRLTPALVDQLTRCADDEARNILMRSIMPPSKAKSRALPKQMRKPPRPDNAQRMMDLSAKLTARA
jgi:hypothetical protein